MNEEKNQEETPIYENGLPFSKSLIEPLQDLFDRVHKHRKASMLIIDGGVGEGKTTLAVHITDVLNKMGGQPPLDLDVADQIGMGGVEFAKKLKICYVNKLLVVVYDESGDFNRRGALTRLNAMLNRIFETFRAFKIVVILCLPLFCVLDQDLFDKKIPRLLLNCYDREDSYGNFRAYSLYRMMYLKKKMEKLTIKDYAYTMVEPNFYGHFKDLAPKRSEQLDKLSTKGKIKELDQAGIKFEGLVTYQDIATKLVRSIQWIRDAMKELNIRHKKIINKAKYFDKAVIDLLADYMDDVDNRPDNQDAGAKKKAIEKFKLKEQGEEPLFDDDEETNDI